MNVKKLKEILQNAPDDAEVYFSVWMGGDRYGEVRFRSRLSSPDHSLSPSKKFFRVTWVDDCRNDIISDKEFS